MMRMLDASSVKLLALHHANTVDRYVKLTIFCLFFFEGVVIAAQCIATFLRSIVLPRIWVLGCEYAD